MACVLLLFPVPRKNSSTTSISLIAVKLLCSVQFRSAPFHTANCIALQCNAKLRSTTTVDLLSTRLALARKFTYFTLAFNTYCFANGLGISH
jgi:hypothetical protein